MNPVMRGMGDTSYGVPDWVYQQGGGVPDTIDTSGGGGSSSSGGWMNLATSLGADVASIIHSLNTPQAPATQFVGAQGGYGYNPQTGAPVGPQISGSISQAWTGLANQFGITPGTLSLLALAFGAALLFKPSRRRNPVRLGNPRRRRRGRRR